MMIVDKYEGKMSARERVRKTFEFEKTDRVPIDYSTNPGIHQRLAIELGVDPGGGRTKNTFGLHALQGVLFISHAYDPGQFTGRKCHCHVQCSAPVRKI